MAIPKGYEHKNVVLPAEVWEEILKIAGELTHLKGKRIPMYEALTIVVKLGLQEYQKRSMLV